MTSRTTITLAAGALASVLCASTALADGDSRWRGCYFGGVVGYEHSDTAIAPGVGPVISNAEFNAVRLGGTIGCNYMAGSNFLLGIEGDLVTHFSQSESGSFGLTEQTSDYAGSIRARAGFVVQNILLYATAGYGFAHFKGETVPPPPVLIGDDSFSGFVYGVGFEHFISQNFSLKLQYTHTNYDEATSPSPFFGVDTRFEPTTDAIDVALLWHL